MEIDSGSDKGVVRLAKPPGSYRHGDLRNALTSAATELTVQRKGPDFTLREIAARTGVRHAAVYRHFASKNALLERIADQGFVALEAIMREKIAPAGDPISAIETIMTTYLDFALERPGEYRVMFMAQLVDEPNAARTNLLALLNETISHTQQAGFLRSDIQTSVLRNLLWAKMHGLAMLVLDMEISVQEARESRLALFDLWRNGVMNR